MRSLLLIAALSGCASRAPRFPGPLGHLADAKPRAVHMAQPPSGTADPHPEPRSITPPRERPARASGSGQAVADAARHYLEHTPSGFRNDCSGFVMAAYARAGLSLTGNSRSLWDDAKEAGTTHQARPRPGDLAFFDDTYDRNGNGRRDDPLTHVAIVLEVDPDGTILLAHGGTSQGRTTLRMNLQHPGTRTDDAGRVLNDPLRARPRGAPDGPGYLAGELFRGFARAADAASDVADGG